MKNHTLSKVLDLGQSFWLDFISKEILDNGSLQKHITEDSLMGLTSNPVIFENTISKTNLYDQDILALKKQGVVDEKLIYENLAIKDLQRAADLFLPVYEKTMGKDGYVSLEVSPLIAFDAKATIEEGKKLWKSVNRKNLMIKVPGTKEGFTAIYELTKAGINVNVTLLFSTQNYLKAAQAYLDGLKERLNKGLPINNIHSVASFFLSRIDSKIDTLLEGITNQAHKNIAQNLLGKVAIANAKKAYLLFEDLYQSQEVKKLLDNGANPQRLLWASTGTKNPHYSDILYVQTLIGKDTVNTMPPRTLESFKDHGQAKATLLEDIDLVDNVFDNLKQLGIDINQKTDELLTEGLQIFNKAFESMLDSVKEKSMSLEKKK